MKEWFVEVTDTYAGEANYSWVRRYRVRGNTLLGVIRKISAESGYRFRKIVDFGDYTRYDAKNANVCAFVEQYDPDRHDDYTVTVL